MTTTYDLASCLLSPTDEVEGPLSGPSESRVSPSGALVDYLLSATKETDLLLYGGLTHQRPPCRPYPHPRWRCFIRDNSLKGAVKNSAQDWERPRRQPNATPRFNGAELETKQPAPRVRCFYCPRTCFFCWSDCSLVMLLLLLLFAAVAVCCCCCCVLLLVLLLLLQRILLILESATGPLCLFTSELVRACTSQPPPPSAEELWFAHLRRQQHRSKYSYPSRPPAAPYPDCSSFRSSSGAPGASGKRGDPLREKGADAPGLPLETFAALEEDVFLKGPGKPPLSSLERGALREGGLDFRETISAANRRSWRPQERERWRRCKRLRHLIKTGQVSVHPRLCCLWSRFWQLSLSRSS